jgi:hypothetical protein
MKAHKHILYLTSLYRAISSVNYRHRRREKQGKCFGVQREGEEEEEEDVSFVTVRREGRDHLE